jgi:hypothetical protein
LIEWSTFFFFFAENFESFIQPKAFVGQSARRLLTMKLGVSSIQLSVTHSVLARFVHR